MGQINCNRWGMNYTTWKIKAENLKKQALDKINKIPNIEATPSQLEIFRVWFEGNLNDNSKLKIKMKSLK